MKQLFNFLIILLAFFQIHLKCLGQNLVPNPGFEKYKICPTGRGLNFSDGELGTYCADWSNFGIDKRLDITGQYLNSCVYEEGHSNGYNMNGVPQSAFGFQNAYSGSAMIKLAFSLGGGPLDKGLRNFFGVKLIQPLKVGHRYDVSFMVSAADSNFDFYDKLGITFFTEQIEIPDFIVPRDKKTFQNFAHVYSDKIISDKINWQIIQGSFIADSAYEYLVIGNFFDFDLINFKHDSDFSLIKRNTINYFIDEVKVEEASKSINYSSSTICGIDSIKIKSTGSDKNFWWSLNKIDTFSILSEFNFWKNSKCTLFLISTNNIDSVVLDFVATNSVNIQSRDSILCEISITELSTSLMCEQYLWNTGEKTSNIVVNKPGIYSVQCILKGCTIWDSTMIEGCDFKLNFPNAFTPNGDGLNDAFSPKGVLVYDFNLRIFNKWGTQIFYSNDINQGWNGDGMPCDVYFYICEFKDFLGINYAKSGNFTLLR